MKTKESTLDKIRTRPRFKLLTELSPEQYHSHLSQYLNEHRKEFSGSINRDSAQISVRSKHKPFYKPQLTLRATHEDDSTVIRGIFGPSPSVWTFFMFLYFILAVLLMVFLTLYFVGRQIQSTDYSWSIWMSLFIGLCFLGLYLAARWGQSKGKAEMERLRYFAIHSTLEFEKKENLGS